MKMVDEFKTFIARGSVVDLAVAVVIGAAFGRIVTALVDGIVMPIIATVTGGVSVDDWKYVVEPARLDAAGAEVAAEVAIRYGTFLQSVIDFLLIAVVIFLFVRAYNHMRAPPDAPPQATPEDVLLLREIRDALRRTGTD
ncbi:MAG: large conductance mechanosensitive channel protein MscL [Pseudomonadota bacterium]|nr:large conductance mechanosensitive channel protein MscL [Pseudomonadota bacterium]